MKKLLITFCLSILLAVYLPSGKADAQSVVLSAPSIGQQLVVNVSGSVTFSYIYTGPNPLGVFEIQIDDDADFSSPVVWVPNGQLTSYSEGGLEVKITYYWRVRASYFLSGYWYFGPWTSAYNFSIVIPRLLSPSDGATNQLQPLLLDWIAIASPKIMNSGHQIYVDNNSNFSSPEINTTTRNSSYSASGLSHNTKYYWKVRYYFEPVFPPGPTVYYNWSVTSNFTTGCDPASIPVLSSPANGSTDMAQPISLTWVVVTNADNYNIQISKNSGFSPTIVSALTASTNYEASGLEAGTTYYWRVGAHECAWGSYSPYRSFTTACPLPAPPGLTSPSDGATGLGMPFLLDWNDVANADMYRVVVDNNDNFSSPEIDESPSSSEYNVSSGLEPGVTYYWRIMAHSDCGYSVWSASRSLTTECSIPAVPSLELPPNGVTDLSSPIVLDWADVSGATKYHIQIDDSPGFGSLIVSADNIPVSSSTVNGLDDATQYYWRIRAGNLCGWSDWSDIRNFTTNCPLVRAPMQYAPDDNEINIDVREKVSLTWDYPPGNIDFHVQVATSDAFSSLIAEHIHTSSGYTIQYPLQAGTWYFWRVRTNNACGSGDWSNVRKFQPNCPAVGIANLESPSNGAINITQPIELNWEDVAEATRYDVQVDDDIGFGSLEVNDENIAVSEFTLPNLIEGINYNWRIRVHNGCQWGDWSTVWNFVAGEQTDVNIISLDEIPEDFTLKQNYPNPFNPATTLEFALPRASYVTLDIHNILGEKVETLIARPMSAGSYSVTWNASSVPSGIYFYQITAGQFTETKKMTLVK
ncbi:MAG: T9SS type A sorting domain-containing protein [candidate division Zixibacteria bacterium]|nr:T9SS type A sorting domain-containing protein [candidate division Zixibacteria bacterium]